MSNSDAMTSSLGAYLLGALPPAEHAEVEHHLGGCSNCRAELTALAGLPGLLARLDATDVDHLEGFQVATDDQLLDRTLLELTRRKRVQRRHGRLLAAAAAIIVAVVTATAVTTLRAAETNETRQAQGQTVSAMDAASGLHAVVAFQQQPWGTAVHLSLRGVPPGTRCELIAVLTDGRRQTAGAWQASYEGTASIDAATDAHPDQLASFEVVTRTGTRLVAVSLRNLGGTYPGGR